MGIVLLGAGITGIVLLGAGWLCSRRQQHGGTAEEDSQDPELRAEMDKLEAPPQGLHLLDAEMDMELEDMEMEAQMEAEMLQAAAADEAALGGSGGGSDAEDEAELNSEERAELEEELLALQADVGVAFDDDSDDVATGTTGAVQGDMRGSS